MTRKARGLGLVAACGALGVLVLAFGQAPGLSRASPPKPSAKSAVCANAPDGVAEYALSPGKTLDRAINTSLTGEAGDPERGVKWAVSPRLGHCIACHQIPALKVRIQPEAPATKRRFGYHGTLGPSLEGAGSRYTEGELRLLVVDARLVLHGAIKPVFHSLDGLHDVAPPCRGKPILSAQQVEDIVAFLKTLK